MWKGPGKGREGGLQAGKTLLALESISETTEADI